ncbi:MAG: hypothetical protein KGZ58_13140 [Ignavibacteriales bacterium]|nr:hypothetical protein [Ignavibacteriales bacterium]
MSILEETIIKIQQLPEQRLYEVCDFTDFLLSKRNQVNRESSQSFGLGLEESDFSDYLSNLEEYENRLSLGEISWK